ncbi:MAG: Arc family DNA-binding protein [Planctomycetia bacterium]|nr:Arc family DNA-binding protein [Planctomycetia bacterium]
MPVAMTLKSIPDDVYDRLKTAAKAHHRSLNKEAIACLERALQQPEVNVAERLARFRELRASLKPRKFKSRDILRAIEQGRA